VGSRWLPAHKRYPGQANAGTGTRDHVVIELRPGVGSGSFRRVTPYRAEGHVATKRHPQEAAHSARAGVGPDDEGSLNMSNRRRINGGAPRRKTGPPRQLVLEGRCPSTTDLSGLDENGVRSIIELAYRNLLAGETRRRQVGAAQQTSSARRAVPNVTLC